MDTSTMSHSEIFINDFSYLIKKGFICQIIEIITKNL